MKKLKTITLSLLILLTVFTFEGRGYFSIVNIPTFVIENTTNELESDDLSVFGSENIEGAGDINIELNTCTFNFKQFGYEKVITGHFFFPSKLSYQVWQPPKFS